MTTGRGRSLGDIIRQGDHSFSFEFFPPKDEAGEEQLWNAIRALEPYRPTFVSVTYGAGGTTRDKTVAITGRIARETSLMPMAHLTCVGHTREELEAILDAYAAEGVFHVMALRGDPREGPGAEWTPTEGGLNYALELVELARTRGDFRDRRRGVPRGAPAAPSRSTSTPTGWWRRPTPAPSSRSPRCSSGPRTTSGWSSGCAPAASTSRSCPASCRS